MAGKALCGQEERRKSARAFSWRGGWLGINRVECDWQSLRRGGAFPGKRDRTGGKYNG